MGDSTQIVVGLPEYESLKATNEKPTTVLTPVQRESAPKIVRIGSIVGLIIFALASAIPIIQLYIGRRYADKCPIDWHIPHYLVIAGLVVILGIIQNILTLKVSENHAEKTPKMGSASGLLCVVCLLSILLLFLFIWFIVGSIWVFRSWNKVQYVDSNQGDYCHPVLYRFAFWLLLIALVFKILSCWKMPLEIKKLKNARSIPTTTGP